MISYYLFFAEWPRNQLTDYLRPITIMFDAGLGTLCMAIAVALVYNSTSFIGECIYIFLGKFQSTAITELENKLL